MPIGFRSPDAKVRRPLPSRFTIRIAARGGSSRLTFEAEPTLTYSFVPSRLTSSPRVECPPAGSGVIVCGGPLAAS